MQRRTFIKTMTAAGLVLVPSALGGCAGPLAAYSGWRDPAGERDIRRLVLSYGILAPNPHNKQPWIVRLDGEAAFFLHVDPARLLPETDPPARQIHIGQGTLLENVALAAGHFGYRAQIDYFPAGTYESSRLEAKPVARVALVPDPAAESDPLFAHILQRQSNKRPYDGSALTPAEVTGLLRAYEPTEYPLRITADPARVKKIADLATRAMAAEVSSPARDRETIAMFRFDDEEMNRYRDGFGLPQLGITGLRRFFAETFAVSRSAAEAKGSTFGKDSVDLTRSQAESAAAWGWLTSGANERVDQVKVGRAYERVALTATSLGVAQHPMSQILEEYADMATLQRELHELLGVPEGHTVQMLFRLGHAEPVVHAPRRALGDIARGSG
jgi:Nitroreductase family